MKSALSSLLVAFAASCAFPQPSEHVHRYADALLYQWHNLDWRSNAIDFTVFDNYISRAPLGQLNAHAEFVRSVLSAWRSRTGHPPLSDDNLRDVYMHLVHSTTNITENYPSYSFYTANYFLNLAEHAVTNNYSFLAALSIAHLWCYVAETKYIYPVYDQRLSIEWERMRLTVKEFFSPFSSPAAHNLSSFSFVPGVDPTGCFPAAAFIEARADLSNRTFTAIHTAVFARTLTLPVIEGQFSFVSLRTLSVFTYLPETHLSAPVPASLDAVSAALPSALFTSVIPQPDPLDWFSPASTQSFVHFGGCHVLSPHRVYATNTVHFCWRPGNDAITALLPNLQRARLFLANAQRILNASRTAPNSPPQPSPSALSAEAP